MAVEVFIKRKVSQGPQAREIIPLILQLRTLATVQSGYISGRTLIESGATGELLIISTWETLEDWKRWSKSSQRMKIDQQIEAVTGIDTEYKIYESLPAHAHE